jgi:hypothetical protein
MGAANGTVGEPYREPIGVDVINITDKAFRYTNSFNTDLKKKFRKMEQEMRATAANSKAAEAAASSSVVPLMARRSLPKA